MLRCSVFSNLLTLSPSCDKYSPSAFADVSPTGLVTEAQSCSLSTSALLHGASGRALDCPWLTVYSCRLWPLFVLSRASTTSRWTTTTSAAQSRACRPSPTTQTSKQSHGQLRTLHTGEQSCKASPPCLALKACLHQLLSMFNFLTAGTPVRDLPVHPNTSAPSTGRPQPFSAPDIAAGLDNVNQAHHLATRTINLHPRTLLLAAPTYGAPPVLCATHRYLSQASRCAYASLALRRYTQLFSDMPRLLQELEGRSPSVQVSKGGRQKSALSQELRRG